MSCLVCWLTIYTSKPRNVNFTFLTPPSSDTRSVIKEWRWTHQRSELSTSGHVLPRSRNCRDFWDLLIFIGGLSAITVPSQAPLTSLLKGKPKKLLWTQHAQSAFEALRTSFTTAPILKHPDPNLPFIVEVDASDFGIGAVLSQRHGN